MAKMTIKEIIIEYAASLPFGEDKAQVLAELSEYESCRTLKPLVEDIVFFGTAVLLGSRPNEPIGKWRLKGLGEAVRNINLHLKGQTND